MAFSTAPKWVHPEMMYRVPFALVTRTASDIQSSENWLYLPMGTST